MKALLACPIRQGLARFRLDDLAVRQLTGISWTTLGNLVAAAASLVGAFLLARMFGPSGFGEFGLIQGTLGIFNLLAGPALGVTLTKSVAEFRHSDPVRLGRIIRLVFSVTFGFSLASAAVLFLGAGPIASRLLKAPGLAAGLQVASFALLFTAVNAVQLGILWGFEAYRAVAQVNIVRGLVTLPSMWIGGRLFGPSGAIGGVAAGWCLACLQSRVLARRLKLRHSVPLRNPGAWAESRLILAFSVPAWLGPVMGGIANWSCNILIARQAGGLVQAGILNAANQIFLVLMFLPQVANQAALPILSERTGARDAGGARRVLRRLVKVNFLLTGPLAVAVAAASPLLMGRFGPGFASGWPVLAISVLSVPVYAIAVAGVNQVIARGEMWIYAAIYAIYMMVMVGSCLVLRQHGAMGLSLSRLLGFMGFGLGALWQVRRPRQGQAPAVAP